MKLLATVALTLGFIAHNPSFAGDIAPCLPSWWTEATVEDAQQLLDELTEEGIEDLYCGENEAPLLEVAIMSGAAGEVVQTLLEGGLSLGLEEMSTSLKEAIVSLEDAMASLEEVKEVEVEVVELILPKGQHPIKSYVSVGIGISENSSPIYGGQNADTTCYPTDICFVDPSVPSPAGFMWQYDLDALSDTTYEVALGRQVNDRFSMEMALSEQSNELNSQFKSLTTGEGGSLAPRTDGVITSNPRAGIGSMRTRSVAFNSYYHFSNRSRITPYVGMGVGASKAKVSDVSFHTNYEDISPAPSAYNPELASYNSVNNYDFSDVVFSWQFHLGSDYKLGEKTFLGVRASYLDMQDLEFTGRYIEHPMNSDPNFNFSDRYRDLGSWRGTVFIKRFIK